MLSVLALFFSLLSLGLAIAAVGVATRAHRRSVAMANQVQADTFTALSASAPPPSKDERIARHRGTIQVCRAVERSLERHADDYQAACHLATHRAQAAVAREELRLLGVEA